MTAADRRPYGERHESRETLVARHRAELDRVRALGGPWAEARLALYGAWVGIVTPGRTPGYVNVMLCTDPGVGSMQQLNTHVPDGDYLTDAQGRTR